MAQRFETYEVKPRVTNLGDPKFWNPIFKDLDLRLHTLELMRDGLQSAVDQFQALALSRVNDTLVPIIQDALDRLGSVGTLFNTESLSEVTVGTGTKILTIVPSQRTSWVVTDYVGVIAADDPSVSMVGRVVDYDSATGMLTIDSLVTRGTGTWSAWRIVLSAPPDLDHASRTDNPHATTASQVGAYTKAEVDGAIADVESGIPAVALSAALDDLQPTTFGRARLKDADAAAARTALSAISSLGQALGAGYKMAASHDAGTKTAGTFAPDPLLGNIQHAVNNGAHAIAPPSGICSMAIEYTNGASAGALTSSGFTKTTGTFSTTNGARHILYVTRTANGSHLHITGLY